MRAVCILLAVIGGGALAAAAAIELATGDPAGAGWVLVGPGPFYAVGLVLAFRGPGQRVGAWLLATGAMFLLSVCLGDAVLPLVHGSPAAWIIALAREWAGFACLVAAVERWVLWTAAAAAVLIPVLRMVVSPTAPQSSFSEPGQPVVVSPLYLPAA